MMRLSIFELNSTMQMQDMHRYMFDSNGDEVAVSFEGDRRFIAIMTMMKD